MFKVETTKITRILKFSLVDWGDIVEDNIQCIECLCFWKETEEEVDTDEKGPYILQSEVEKAIQEMRATGNDDVPGECSNYWEKAV